MSETETSPRKGSPRWVWLVVPPAALLAIFVALFGPYIQREITVNRLRANGVTVSIALRRIPGRDLTDYIQLIPGLGHNGCQRKRMAGASRPCLLHEIALSSLTDFLGMDTPFLSRWSL